MTYVDAVQKKKERFLCYVIVRGDEYVILRNISEKISIFGKSGLHFAVRMERKFGFSRILKITALDVHYLTFSVFFIIIFFCVVKRKSKSLLFFQLRELVIEF